jgi:hypothetical protein
MWGDTVAGAWVVRNESGSQCHSLWSMFLRENAPGCSKKMMLLPGVCSGECGPFGYSRGSVPLGSAGAVMIRETELGLFGYMEEKAGNDAVISAYRGRLQKVGGFKYVPEPIPMRNSKGATIYYLFFASQNQTGNKIAESVFKKYRNHVAH